MDHLNAHKHVSAKPVPNVIRGCLISFLMGYDRNDRNDKGKIYLIQTVRRQLTVYQLSFLMLND